MSAPHVKIQAQLPLPLRALLFCMSMAGLAFLMMVYEQGRVPGFNVVGNRVQIEQLKEQVEKLIAERDRYSSTVNAAETKQNMDRSHQKQLELQIKSLEDENIKLKEDLAFFESLLPVDANAKGMSIRRMKSEVVVPNHLHYQLLVMQGGKGDHDFIGNLQLTVTVIQAGKSAMIVFPDTTSTEFDKFKLVFKHYQRIEGVLTLPDGAVPKAVQARILDKGQIRAQQFVYL